MLTYYRSTLEHRDQKNPYLAWFRAAALAIALVFPTGFFLMACGDEENPIPFIRVIDPDGNTVNNGDTYDFGGPYLGDVSGEFTVENQTGAEVDLTGGQVSITGTDFALDTPPPNPLPIGNSTFAILFDYSAACCGPSAETVTISSANDDLDGLTFNLVGSTTS